MTDETRLAVAALEDKTVNELRSLYEEVLDNVRRATPEEDGYVDWDPRLPPPGSFLERRYKGQMIRVLVLTDGFEYEGKRFRSLNLSGRSSASGFATKSRLSDGVGNGRAVSRCWATTSIDPGQARSWWSTRTRRRRCGGSLGCTSRWSP
ncbi:DUF2924 domain-containing protein [Novipirellula artificiosorum]|uniref:Uncharacterized protein n=1 Tax=Novipirellula artificiosorum TaxID=2528016 RepID=A0A5C6DLH2_9BACT|nr:DUF2924 domain-containing protein [Novipirellula artificiosorum]TWU37452.1 hypothetical protein Poly41_35840 [Novipirellula artificiosorum]